MKHFLIWNIIYLILSFSKGWGTDTETFFSQTLLHSTSNPMGICYIRNEALRYLREQQFSGKLIFVDADDYLTSSAVDCFNQFKDADYDLVCFWMEGRDEAGNKTNNADYVNNNLKLYQETGDFSGVRFNSGPSWGKFINEIDT